MEMRNKYSRYFALAAFLIPFLFYLLTYCCTVYVGDSGEMITAAYYLGIPHPPGYPLYTILGKFFSFIPVSNIASRVNLLSSTLAALASFFLFILLDKIFDRKEFSDRIIILAAVLASAFSFTFWNQALMTKGGLYELNALLLVLIMYKLAFAKTQKDILLGAVFFGCGLANHTTMVPLSAVFVLFVFLSSLRKGILAASIDALAFISFSALTAGLIYIYLPIRAAAAPAINWGNPSNLGNFWLHISRQQYKLPDPNDRALSHIIDQTFGYFKALCKQNNLLALFAPAGAVYLFLKNRKMFLLAGAIFLVTSAGLIYFTNYLLNSHDLYIVDPFLISSFIMIFIYGTAGLFLIKEAFPKSGTILVIASAACALFPLAANFYRADKSSNDCALVYGKNLLRTPEKNSLLFVAGDNSTFITCYLTKVEKLRPDLKVYDETGNVFENIYGEEVRGMTDFGTYTKRINEVEWNTINSFKGHIYCVSGTSVHSLPNLTVRSYGMIFEILKDGRSKTGVFDITRYRADSYTNPSFYKDFLSREVIALYYFNLAESAFETGSKDTAEGLYKKALEAGFDMDMIQNDIAISYINKGMLDEAEKYALQAVAINPRFADGFNNLGIISYKKGLFQKAVEYYSKAISISGKDAYLYNLGAVYRQANVPEGALKAYQQALAVNPYSSKMYFMIGNVYLDKNDPENAAKNYELGLKLEPGSAEMLTNLGVAYAQLKKNAEALNAFNRSLAINPRIAESYYSMGFVYHAQKDYPNAINAYIKALNINPSMIQAWTSLALTYTESGRADKAPECYQNITKLRPNNPDDWNNLGISYGILGDNAKAIAAWQQALKLSPGYANARLNIEKVQKGK